MMDDLSISIWLNPKNLLFNELVRFQFSMVLMEILLHIALSHLL